MKTQSFGLLVLGLSMISSIGANAHAEVRAHTVADMCRSTANPARFPVDSPFTPISDTRKTWDPANFSNPAQHDPNHFMYFVHEIDVGERNDAPDYLADPDFIQSDWRICASVIRNDHVMTYSGRIALILQVPIENIGPMGPDDLASGNGHSYNTVSGGYNFAMQKFPLLTPATLMERSISNMRYNEVDLIGTNCSTQTQVHVVGVVAECKQWKRVLGGETTHLWNPKTEPDLFDECMGDYKYQDLAASLKKLSNQYPVLLMRN